MSSGDIPEWRNFYKEIRNSVTRSGELCNFGKVTKHFKTKISAKKTVSTIGCDRSDWPIDLKFSMYLAIYNFFTKFVNQPNRSIFF